MSVKRFRRILLTRISWCAVLIPLSVLTWAQGPILDFTSYTNLSSRYSVPQILSPDASSLAEYGRVPVDLSIGAVNISIPLTSLIGKRYSVPVGLSYQATGHKTETHPGCTGLGWSLQSGGCVSRIVRGFKDEMSREESIYTRTIDSNDPANLPANLPSPGYYYHPEAVRRAADSDIVLDSLLYYPGVVDYEPDEFLMNLGGKVVTFFIGNDGLPTARSDDGTYYSVQIDTIDTGNTPYLFWSSGQYFLNVHHFCYFSKITVTDKSGTRYEFGGSLDAIDFSYVQTWMAGPGPHVVGTANTWYLTKIQTPEEEIIDFNYQKMGYPVVVSDIQTKIFAELEVWEKNITLHEPWQYNKYPRVIEHNLTEEYADLYGHDPVFSNLSYTFLRPSYIISIHNQTTNRQVSFSYSASLGLDNLINPDYMMFGLGCFGSGEGAYFNKESFLAETKYYKLDIINDGDKSVRFDYLHIRPDSQTQGLMRLRLDAVRITSQSGATEKAWRFQYNDIFLPGYNSKLSDHWGYFNNRYYGAAFNVKNMGGMNPTWIQAVVNDMSGQRTPNEYRHQAELLNRIEYPTGGYTKLEYEPCYYHRVISEDLSVEDEVGKAGGVRIKSIIDSIPGRVSRRYFFYHNSGVLKGRPRYLIKGDEHETGSFYWGDHQYLADTLIHFAKASEQCMNRLDNAPTVLYSWVTEVLPDSSRVDYRYTGYDDFSDSLQLKVRGQFCNNPPDFPMPPVTPLPAIIPDIPVLNNSHLRGRLKSEVFINADGDTIKRKDYCYVVRKSGPSIISINKSVVSNKANIRKLAVTSIPINHLSLASEIETEYFPGGSERSKTTSYTYDRYGNVTNCLVSVPGDAEIGTQTVFCSADSLMWPYGVYSSMRAANVLDKPVEVLSLRNGKVTRAQLATYKQEGNSFVPNKEYLAEISSPIDTSSWTFYRPDYTIPSSYGKVARHYRSYDGFGNPTAVMDGVTGGTMMKWSSNGVYPLAAFTGVGPRTDVSYITGTAQNHLSLRAQTASCVLVRFEAKASGPAELTIWFDEGEERSCYVKLDTMGTYYYHPKPISLPPGVRDHFTYEIQNVSTGWHAFQIALTPDDFYSTIPDAIPILPGTHYFLADADVIYPVPSYEESVSVLPVYYEDFETNGTIYSGGFESNRCRGGGYSISMEIPAGVDYRADWMENNNGVWSYKFCPFTGNSIIGLGAFAIDNVRVYPVGAEVRSWTWWPSGKLRSETNEHGESVRYRYDYLDRLISVIDKDGDTKTDYSYEYASAGNSLYRNAITTTRYTSANVNPAGQVVEQLFDGLGRLSSTVRKGASPIPGGGDLRDSCWYDVNGRLIRKGLSVPVNDPSFYGTEEEPYSEINYDGSPLNRPVVEYGPGKEWHDAGRGIRTRYLTNNFSDSLSCNKWSVSWTLDTLVSVHSLGVYPEGALRVTHVSDEEGHTLIRFVDLEDKPVLERNVLREYGGSVSYIDTYYVYDSFGRLSTVLPPELSNYLNSSSLTSWNCQSSSEIRQYAYIYRYDDKGRCVAKKLPGCDWTLMVYDRNDRLVFTQDPELREHFQWRFSIPDERGRECLTGIIRSSTLNPFDDPFYAWPIRARRSNDGVFGYVVDGYDISANTVQRVLWWDDYRFLGSWGIPAGTDPRTSFSASESLMSAEGLLTGELNAIYGGGNVNSYLWSLHYYDGFGREIQTNLQTPGSVEKEVKNYDFVGNVASRVLSHLDATGNLVLKETYTYEYDSWSRPLTVHHRLGQYGLNVCLRSNSYDAVGRLNGCGRASSAALMESLYHNVRSWPDSLLVGVDGNTFRQDMGYTWNGNISALAWTSSDGNGAARYDFTYDHLSHLLRALYTPVTGNQRRTVWSYDRNGNMTTEEEVDITSFGRILPVSSTAYTLRGNRVTLQLSALGGGILPLRVGLDSLSGPIFPFIDPPDNFIYDACGRLISDANRSLSVSYNSLGLPKSVDFGGLNARSLYYVYSADGRKLEQGTFVPATGFGQLMYVPHITYRGNLVYVDGALDRILIDGGYISAADNAYHFFITDHLGSVRLVAASDGTVERRYDFKPYGEDLNASALPDYPSSNPYKFSGKELDGELSAYDFSARIYSPDYRRWTTMDPLCEKYYSISPYAYCAGNPVNLVDPDGRIVLVHGNKPIDAIYNMLDYHEARYVCFDSGVLNNERLMQYNGDSSILNILSALSNSETVYSVSVSNSINGNRFYDVGENLDNPNNYFYGQTLMPNYEKSPSPDDNVYVYSADFLGPRQLVQNIAHELLGHAYFYELSKKDPSIIPGHTFSMQLSVTPIYDAETKTYVYPVVAVKSNTMLEKHIQEIVGYALSNFDKYHFK